MTAKRKSRPARPRRRRRRSDRSRTSRRARPGQEERDEEGRPEVRGDQVGPRRLAHFLALVLERHQEERRQRHDLPRHQEQHAVAPRRPPAPCWRPAGCSRTTRSRALCGRSEPRGIPRRRPPRARTGPASAAGRTRRARRAGGESRPAARPREGAAIPRRPRAAPAARRRTPRRTRSARRPRRASDAVSARRLAASAARPPRIMIASPMRSKDMVYSSSPDAGGFGRPASAFAAASRISSRGAWPKDGGFEAAGRAG